MAIRVGCADFTWPLLPHEVVLRHIKALEFDGVDLGLFGNRSHLRPEVIREDVPMWAGRVRERLDRIGLEVADVFLVPWTSLTRMAINNPDVGEQRDARALFLDALDFTRRIGGPGMTMNSGVLFDGESSTDSIRRSAEGLRWRVEEAGKFDIQVRIEGGVGTNTETPEKLLELVSLTPGLKLTVDYCHFIYQRIPVPRIEPLLDHAGHFQCRGASEGRMQVRFQENAIDYGGVIDRLKELDYAGYFSIEYVWVDIWHCNECENTMETVQFRDFARARIEGLE